jgi:NADPH:quinone reductase
MRALAWLRPGDLQQYFLANDSISTLRTVPKAIRIHENGGPEVLRWEDVEVPSPGRGEVLLRHTAIGLNYADVNLRRGTFYLHTTLPLPAILGNEGAGVIERLGPEVTEVKVGDRVVYVSPSGMTNSPGAYSEIRVIEANRLVKIPDSVSDQQAAAAFLKGLTAWCIVRRIFPVRLGHVVLVHAAAGGVSSFLTQWSKHLGATVVGTVGNAEKAQVARSAGCDHTILYREVDFVHEVNRLFPNGVSAVFDGVGKDTFLPSLDCLDPFGTLVNFGNASGAPPPLDIRLLANRGAQMVTRMGMGYFFTDRQVLLAAAEELFKLIAQDVLTIRISRTYPLCEAAQAHWDLEARQTMGSVILIP